VRRIRGTVEEDEHPQRLILSMRMKLFLGCLGFVLAMGIIAYLETPNAVQALRSLGRVCRILLAGVLLARGLDLFLETLL